MISIPEKYWISLHAKILLDRQRFPDIFFENSWKRTEFSSSATFTTSSILSNEHGKAGILRQQKVNLNQIKF